MVLGATWQEPGANIKYLFFTVPQAPFSVHGVVLKGLHVCLQECPCGKVWPVRAFIHLVTMAVSVVNSWNKTNQWESEYRMENPLRKKRIFCPAMPFWDSERTECSPWTCWRSSCTHMGRAHLRMKEGNQKESKAESGSEEAQLWWYHLTS